jgi:YHS domain-containing protein
MPTRQNEPRTSQPLPFANVNRPAPFLSVDFINVSRFPDGLHTITLPLHRMFRELENHMQRNLSMMMCIAAALCLAGFTRADNIPGMGISPSTQPSQAVDLRNTICPVSGDKVDNSNLVEIYGGKVYHLCCADCHKDFEKDPAKYASAVAANPAKYGIK